MVNFGLETAEIVAFFLSTLAFFHCPHIHTEVTKPITTKPCYIFGSESDLRMYVGWGSLPLKRKAQNSLFQIVLRRHISAKFSRNKPRSYRQTEKDLQTPSVPGFSQN